MINYAHKHLSVFCSSHAHLNKNQPLPSLLYSGCFHPLNWIWLHRFSLTLWVVGDKMNRMKSTTKYIHFTNIKTPSIKNVYYSSYM